MLSEVIASAAPVLGLILAAAFITIIKQLIDEYLTDVRLKRIAHAGLLAAGRIVDARLKGETPPLVTAEAKRIDEKYDGTLAKLVKQGIEVTRGQIEDTIRGELGKLNAPAVAALQQRSEPTPFRAPTLVP